MQTPQTIPSPQTAGYTEQRPWGEFTVLYEEGCIKTKRILVKPQQLLSLQLHHHREEHWFVVTGVAEVTVGESVQTLTAGQNVFIPINTKHRLRNPGDTPLVITEVQIGSYLGEDDIVRFSDNYGRVA